MNKLIIGTVSLLLAGINNGIAGPAVTRAIYYEVSGQRIFDIAGFAPASDVAFYSAMNGGRLLRTIPLDKDGTLKMVTGKDFSPALVLNRAMQGMNKTGIGNVFYFTGCSFTLDHIHAVNSNGQLLISWDAGFNNPDRYRIELLSTENGKDDRVVDTYTARSVAQADYHYQGQQLSNERTYKLRVVNEQDHISYTTGIIPVHVVPGISVFPTTASQVIHLQSNNNGALREFMITDMQGKSVMSGSAGQDSTTDIDIRNLIPGQYLVKVTLVNHEISTCRFIKQ